MSHHSIVAKFLQNHSGRENADLPLTQADVGNFQAIIGYKFCVPYQISAEAIGDLARLPTQASAWVQEVAEMEVPEAVTLVTEEANEPQDTLVVDQGLTPEEPATEPVVEDAVTEDVEDPVVEEPVAEDANSDLNDADDSFDGEEEDNA